MSETIENTLSKTIPMMLNQENINAVLDEAWALRNASQPFIPLIETEPGLGKTQMIYAWARKQQQVDPNFRVWVKHGSMETPMDNLGYMPDVETGTLKEMVNQNLADACHPDAAGIIFADELTKTHFDVQKTYSRLFNERAIGRLHLSPNVVLVSAGNRLTDKSGDTRLLQMLENRLARIPARHDSNAFIDYIIEKGYNPFLAAYINNAPYRGPDDKNPDFDPMLGQWLSPRSYEVVCQRVDYRGGELPDITQLAGNIGIGRARDLTSFFDTVTRLPSIQEIVLSPSTCRVPTKVDEQCAVTAMLVIRTDKKQADEITEYMHRLPMFLQVLFLKLVNKRQSEFLDTKAYMDWTSEKAIMDAILNRKAA